MSLNLQYLQEQFTKAGERRAIQALLFLPSLLLIWSLFKMTIAVYRLYFHPLARFPGPRAAARSNDWIHKQMKSGHAEEMIEALHKEYNTRALRIGPNELHISDVSLYKILYSQTTPFLKHTGFYNAFGTPHTLFVEADPALHKERRRLLNSFFSRAGILSLEPIMIESIKILQDKIDRLCNSQSINIYNAFRCVTTDIISEYAFGRSVKITQESNDNFYGGFLIAFDTAGELIYDLVYSPILRNIAMALPRSIAGAANHKIKAIFGLADEAERSLEAYKSQDTKRRHTVVFDGLQSISDDQMVAEAVDILTAGSDTTAYSLSTGTWHILSNPDIKNELIDALKDAIPDRSNMPTITKLEEIKYLNACVKEAIRIATPVPGRLPRVVPSSGTPLIVDGKIVPPGAIVGMSAYTMNYSEELWGTDARSFNPNRWLDGKGKSLDQHMSSFSKGVRSCIGQNLASAEAILVMAYIFRNYEMSLDTNSANVTTDADDLFTYNIRAPGVLVKMKPVA